MPQMDISTYAGQIFWLLVSFAILFLGIKFWIHPLVLKVRRDRERYILALKEEIETLQQEVLTLSTHITRALGEAKSQSERMIKEAQDDEQNALRDFQVGLNSRHSRTLQRFKEHLHSSSREVLPKNQKSQDAQARTTMVDQMVQEVFQKYVNACHKKQ